MKDFSKNSEGFLFCSMSFPRTFEEWQENVLLAAADLLVWGAQLRWSCDNRIIWSNFKQLFLHRCSERTSALKQGLEFFLSPNHMTVGIVQTGKRWWGETLQLNSQTFEAEMFFFCTSRNISGNQPLHLFCHASGDPFCGRFQPRGDGEMGDGCRRWCILRNWIIAFRFSWCLSGNTCMHASVHAYLCAYIPTYLLTYVRTCVRTFVDTDVHVWVILHSDWATLFAVGLILWGYYGQTLVGSVAVPGKGKIFSFFWVWLWLLDDEVMNEILWSGSGVE